MKLQRLYSYVRQAAEDYHMIEEGDKIAVGISGGKDSLTLLYALAGLRKFYPVSFEIIAITVDLGYGDFDLAPIHKLCDELEVEYVIEKTEISKIMADGNGGCSLCARLRKGALTNRIVELGCNKIAYAHNMDDVVETMLLSLIYEGRFSTFWPVTKFDDKDMAVIRPLIYVPLEEVIGFKNKYELPVVENPCPYKEETSRAFVRDLLKEMNKKAPGVKKRLLTAIKSGNIPEWNIQ